MGSFAGKIIEPLTTFDGGKQDLVEPGTNNGSQRMAALQRSRNKCSLAVAGYAALSMETELRRADRAKHKVST